MPKLPIDPPTFEELPDELHFSIIHVFQNLRMMKFLKSISALSVVASELHAPVF
ncbi:hypothetical protein Glove_33g298 [Diversispora epigaea]|uniref:Uncharacterized protein n=1 Tax=Diversispora epigaea TaxID=1348612 RepID=A0A397JH12_9GLOM|nr:hypothetical protein Glove_33g298 [Diversispora epigaea]